MKSEIYLYLGYVFEKLVPIDARHIRLFVLRQIIRSARFNDDIELEQAKQNKSKHALFCVHFS